jgi:two-component system response regulator HydG
MPDVLLVSSSDSLAAKLKRLRENLPEFSFQQSCSPGAGIEMLQKKSFIAALVHATAQTQDAEIVEFLHSAGQAKRACPALILAESYRDEQALTFFRAGAVDYLGMPLDPGKLTFRLNVLSLGARPPAKPAAPPSPKRTFCRHDPFFYVVAPQMAEMMEQVRRVAPQDTTLLFTGETGTGKTRLARLIHDLSPRHDQPFMVVDCAALSSNLIESEMFGHVRGAFTGADRDRPGKFAAAGEGTLLLDEINALPLALQCKLLRAVDERLFEPVGSNQPLPLRARLMAVSNAPLDQEVLAGRFRPDLYYRLDVVGFYLPPLRERKAAIAPMCHRFLAEFASRNRPDIIGMAPGVLRALEDYDWPGNVRELRNAIERAVALAKGPLLTRGDLPALVLSAASKLRKQTTSDSTACHCTACDSTGDVQGFDGSTLTEAREEVEIQRIHAALKKHRNNRLLAAAELGISRMGLYKKLHKYGLFETTKTL